MIYLVAFVALAIGFGLGLMLEGRVVAEANLAIHRLEEEKAELRELVDNLKQAFKA